MSDEGEDVYEKAYRIAHETFANVDCFAFAKHTGQGRHSENCCQLGDRLARELTTALAAAEAEAQLADRDVQIAVLAGALRWASKQIRAPEHRVKGQNDAYCDGYEQFTAALANIPARASALNDVVIAAEKEKELHHHQACACGLCLALARLCALTKAFKKS